jgi:hypothetical protein
MRSLPPRQFAYRTGNVVHLMAPIAKPVPIDLSPLSDLCRRGLLSERREDVLDATRLEAADHWRARNDILCEVGLRLAALRHELIRSRVLDKATPDEARYARAMVILGDCGRRPAEATADIVLHRIAMPSEVREPQQFEARLASLRIGLGALAARWGEVERAGDLVRVRR